MEKFCAYPSFPTPKGASECPLYGPEGTQGENLLHLEHTFRITFRTYIQNIHLEITFPTHIRITFIYTTPLYPYSRLPLPTLTFTHIYTHTFRITFRNYISNIHQNYFRIIRPPTHTHFHTILLQKFHLELCPFTRFINIHFIIIIFRITLELHL